MKRLVVVVLVVGLAAAVLCLGATESLTNRSGKTASGVVVTFSELARITSYDQAVFSAQEPTGRATTFTFSGGALANGGRFRVSWTPSSAEVAGMQWVAAPVEAAEAASDLPMGFETTSDTPTVTGDLFNPPYFAHSACVMQGVDDPAKAFALPLLGVPELSFFPTAADVDPTTVIWRVEVSHPNGIGAEVRDHILCVWGNNPAWSGYGTVTLAGAAASGRTGRVVIPVTVFRSDRTLVNSDGKKDYFVPWSPQLDINRILSVEEHMRKYNKDEGTLDRTIQWSRWSRMQQLKDVQVLKWGNPSVLWNRWRQQTQFAFVDVLLDEMARLGVKTVRLEHTYYLPTVTSNNIVPVYARDNHGPSLTPEEGAYVVNEAHRVGLRVLLADWIGVDQGASGTALESWQATPSDLVLLWENYKALVLESLENWAQLGVELGGIDTMAYTGPNTAANRTFINAQLEELASAARTVYSGPLVFIVGGPWPGNFPPWNSILDAPFWAAGDILCVGISLNQLDPLSRSGATDQHLLERWARWIKTYFQPFQERFNKPFIANENGCMPLEGAIAYGLYYSGPVDDPSAVPVDISEMARYFSLQAQAFGSMTGYYGPGLWTFLFNPGYTGGIRDPNNDLRLKIDDPIREMFCGPADTESIHIDGSVDDWPAAALLASDPRGDVGARGVDDLLALYGAEGDRYYYIRLDYAQPPCGYLTLGLDTDADGSPEVAVVCNNRWTSNHRWTATLETPAHNPWERIGVADIVDAGASLEMRIAKRYLPSARGRIAICSVQDYDEANGSVWAIVSDEIRGPFEIPELP